MKNAAFAICDVNVAHAHCGLVLTLTRRFSTCRDQLLSSRVVFKQRPLLSSLMKNILTTHVQKVLLSGVLFIATLWTGELPSVIIFVYGWRYFAKCSERDKINRGLNV